MTERCEFFQRNKEFAAQPLLYKECGLDDIYLLNGFKRRSSPYGDGVTVSNIDGLHKAIGMYLIMNRKVLAPQELRFLRRKMDMTQADLARCLRLSDQQVARWEKGECEISGPSEVLIRMFFILHHLPRRQQAKFIHELQKKMDKLSKQDDRKPSRAAFQETDDGWIKAHLPPAHMCASAIAIAL